MSEKLVPSNVFNYLIRVTNELFPPQRVQRARNRDIIYQVLRVLRYGVPWRDTGKEGRYSWQTVYRRFCAFVKKDIIHKTWIRVIERYTHHKNEENKQHFQNLFVDTTFIKNIGGIDCIGRNSTDRGWKATKVSIVCDENRIVLGCYASPCSHDTKLVESTLDSMPFDLKQVRKRKVTYLVADKAYASYKLSDRLGTRNIHLITEKKKNQRRHTNAACARPSARIKLAKRCTVEHSFAIMKRFKRIARREERYCTQYMAFFYLGLIIRTTKQIPPSIIF